MARRRRTRHRGQGMVEFALAVPVLLLVIFGMVDFSRAINANSTVADAARQGARQMAPAAVSSDSPFGTYSGACSGTTLAANASGSGCLTDAAVLATVKSVLAPLTTNVTPYYATLAASCPTPIVAGAANVCIAPSQTAAATTGLGGSCSSATTALGHTPQVGDLGGRQAEWASPQYASGRCFLVQVTVRYAFGPWTPVINKLVGSTIQITSSTSTVAEY